MYFNNEPSENCDVSNTETIRNFFVQEEDAPFSFDIISNKFLPSPFLLENEKCGTNIYEIQTEVSVGSTSVTTTVKNLIDYALKTSLASSISNDIEINTLTQKISSPNDQDQIKFCNDKSNNWLYTRIIYPPPARI